MKTQEVMVSETHAPDSFFFAILGFQAAKYCARAEFPRFHPAFFQQKNEMAYYHRRAASGLAFGGLDVAVTDMDGDSCSLRIYRYSPYACLREIDYRCDEPFACGARAWNYLMEEYAIPNPRCRFIQTSNYCVVKE